MDEPIFISWSFRQGKGLGGGVKSTGEVLERKVAPGEPQTMGLLDQRISRRGPLLALREASGGRAGSCDAGNVTPRKGPSRLEKRKHFSRTDWTGGEGSRAPTTDRGKCT